MLSCLGYVLIAVAAVAGALLAYALCGLVFMLLWNLVMAGVFHLPLLSFLQSAALVLLMSIVGGLLFNHGGSKS